MAKKCLIMLVLFDISPLHLSSQADKKNFTWTGIANEVKIKKLSVTGELENSRLIAPFRQDYFTLYCGLDYAFDKLRPGAGFSYWLLYTGEGLVIPEWRPHAQLEWLKEQRIYTLQLRLRLENRFVKDTADSRVLNTYNYFLRPRFLLQGAYSLYGQRDKKNNLQLVVYNELLVNRNVQKSLFPENRLYLGLWYKTNKTVSLRLGFVRVFSDGTGVRNANVWYLTLKNDLVLKK
jgi:hypothetical protein